MKYFSTRGNSEALNFVDVLTSGTAKDGGLYVPENFPEFSKISLKFHEIFENSAR